MRKISTLIILLFLCSFEYNQSEENENYFDIIVKDFNYAFDDLFFIANDIYTTGTPGLIKVGASVASSVALVPLDRSTHQYFLRPENRSKFQDDFFGVTDWFGTIPVADGLAVGTYLTGLFFEDEYIRTTGRLMVESLVLSGFITISTRIMIGRSRPYIEENNLQFNPFTLDYNYHSFPSGHITVSFALATIISHRIDKWWGYIGMYSLAGMNAYSRLYFHGHWISDIPVSAAVGTLSALAVLKAYDHNSEENVYSNYDLNFSLTGIYFTYRF